ncbi:MAG: surface-adhesin E family protein [Burkholderiales bacterium]
MKYFAALLLALAALPGARAATWIAVPLPPQADLYYYDNSKLFIEREEITYWKKVLFRTPQPTKDGAAVSGLFRERIHCAEHTLRLISYLLTAADGRTLEYVENKEGAAAPIIPDSVGDAFEGVLCPLVKARQEKQRLADEAAKEAEKVAQPAPALAPVTAPVAAPIAPVPAPETAQPPATSPEDKPPATPPDSRPLLPRVKDKPPATPPARRSPSGGVGGKNLPSTSEGERPANAGKSE